MVNGKVWLHLMQDGHKVYVYNKRKQNRFLVQAVHRVIPKKSYEVKFDI